MSDDGSNRSIPPPLQHRTKAEAVYEHLREQIVNGTYAPGRRLTLAELTAEIGLSQMPVREAMLRLEREGLLVSEPHKGMRVVTLSLTDAREIFEIRCELEGLAAFRACRSGDTALVADLETANERFAAAYRASDFTAMGTANWAFHRRLLRAAASAQLTRSLEDIWTASQRYRLGYQLIPGRAAQTIAEHAAIIDAIRAGDPEAARAAARRHIQHAGEELASTVGHTEVK